MARYFDKQQLKTLKEQIERQAIERAELRIKKAAYSVDKKIYWPSHDNPVLWAYAHSRDEMYMGLELWLQHLYDLRPNEMPRKPLNGYNTNKARFRFWSMLSDKWNQGTLTVEFIETN